MQNHRRFSDFEVLHLNIFLVFNAEYIRQRVFSLEGLPTGKNIVEGFVRSLKEFIEEKAKDYGVVSPDRTQSSYSSKISKLKRENRPFSIIKDKKKSNYALSFGELIDRLPELHTSAKSETGQKIYPRKPDLADEKIIKCQLEKIFLFPVIDDLLKLKREGEKEIDGTNFPEELLAKHFMLRELEEYASEEIVKLRGGNYNLDALRRTARLLDQKHNSIDRGFKRNAEMANVQFYQEVSRPSNGKGCD